MRIWFNRGFSLNPIAKAMRAGDDRLEVLISTSDERAIYPDATDQFVEPVLDHADYAEWCAEQIVKRGIDIFVPTLHRQSIYAADLPCKVHFPCSAADHATLDDKQAFSDATRDFAGHLPTFTAASADELEHVLAIFERDFPGSLPCVKPRRGVNGHGFWKLTDHSPAAHLLHPEYRNMRKDVFVSALRAQEHEAPIVPLVVMGYLPGPEVSFDVLAHEGEILKYAARTKFERSQIIQSHHPLEDAARQLVHQFRLSGVNNLQFRKAADETWKILEINARPAGGSTFAEDFGSNLIADWAGLLTGRLTPAQIERTVFDIELETTQIRRPIDRESVK